MLTKRERKLEGSLEKRTRMKNECGFSFLSLWVEPFFGLNPFNFLYGYFLFFAFKMSERIGCLNF